MLILKHYGGIKILTHNQIKNTRTSITLTKEDEQILDKYCKLENRSRSNMISQMVRAYDLVHKNQY